MGVLRVVMMFNVYSLIFFRLIESTKQLSQLHA